MILSTQELLENKETMTVMFALKKQSHHITSFHNEIQGRSKTINTLLRRQPFHLIIVLDNKNLRISQHLVNYHRAKIQQQLNRNLLDQKLVSIGPMIACPRFTHLLKAFSCISTESMPSKYLLLLITGMLLIIQLKNQVSAS